ncbi:MAG: anhydro-N-acetylmuramic acid kinase AnmK [Defluviitaleaceae bacterium]|nr:anhydro-N-acetylmuramic acid kinase AnmK [Defluviitaleaceae bacterium]
MLERLQKLSTKNEKYVIGLMSGTSVDGIDAALVRISGNYTATTVDEIAFETYPYPEATRELIFRLFDDSNSADICHMNFLLGGLFADAAVNITKKAGIDIQDIDLIGSHGQTIYHIPEPTKDYPLKSTLQIGESAVIAHKTGRITVSDFRTADMAAGGVGAPLVPYTEFLLFSGSNKNIALQNIGGIGNITAIPQNAIPESIIAFDTGPGNMIIDYLTQKIFGRSFDKNGEIAAKGAVCPQILAHLMDSWFIKKAPPKATGRELFGKSFSEKLYTLCKEKNMLDADIIATATAFTAQSISYSLKHIPFDISQIIVAGGGAYNHALMQMISNSLPSINIIAYEQIGKNSNAKEAVAFAILANETICGNTSNLPSVTGASCSKILGKISI